MEPPFDASAAFPPLRPAADLGEQPAAPAEGEQQIVAPKEIEEHEVEMYKEQDVRLLSAVSRVRAERADPAPPSFAGRQRYLPIANVGRIMKKCLPDTTKVSKDAKECVQECTSEFISFITSEAAERCQVEKRKTINGEDILFAMTTLGFENYAEVLKVYLAKYREHQRSTGKRAQKRAAKEAAQAQAQAEGEPEYEEDEEAGDYADSVEGDAE
ncbi:SPOSA6832_04100, partial [Sporobolomyces salmonicolor]